MSANAQQNLLDELIKKIDAFNQQDPNQEQDESGQSQPKELLYGQRMSLVLNDFYQDAPVALQVAARAQHIGRWLSPRSDYPMDRPGYLKWRSELGKKHAEICAELMQQANAEQSLIDEVSSLLRKEKIKRNPLTQALEDVICLVFLRYYFAEFAAKHEDDKVISILQKTWAKMSEQGHQAALGLPLAENELSLVKRALGA